jgi:hypothetical protein
MSELGLLLGRITLEMMSKTAARRSNLFQFYRKEKALGATDVIESSLP